MDLEKWRQYNFAFQIGQIGAEVSRARGAEERKDLRSRDAAIFRALELLDLSLSDRRWKVRYREIARFREILCDWLCGTQAYQFSVPWLENYCTRIVLASQATL